MGSGGVQVEPEMLELVSGEVALVREAFDKAAKDVHAGSEVGRKLAGWRIARASDSSAFGWEDDAARASGWLEDHTEALARCAQDYRHLDRVTADTLALFPDLD